MAKKYLYLDTATGRQEADDGPAGGGPLAVYTAANQSAISADGIFTSDYDVYIVEAWDLVSQNDATTLFWGWRSAGSDVTGGTAYSTVDLQYPTNNSTTTAFSAANAHPLCIPNQWGNDANERGRFTLKIYPRTTSRKTVRMDVMYDDSAVNVPVHVEGMSYLANNTVMDGFKLFFGAGNIVSGTVTISGVKKTV